ncbi:hypothetical protein SJI00_20910 [Pseudomonas sp. RP23018S]|uniref:hypothetical protein n=1 Tax=Pseudomonas sp. RP23018S TaxID=3096037 RepID=UPI002ACAD54A|nr:hypothetical protein [Pseudomonas sp. RP23018S]MDZ5605237.1 hypothetical protein [Pseudomonas sp. RP23018S]
MSVENELAARLSERMSTELSADEELDAVREMESLSREDAGSRVEPTLDLNDVESLLDRAFESATEESSDHAGMDSTLSEDDLLDSASFGEDDLSDDALPGADSSEEIADETTAGPGPNESLMERLGESFGDKSKGPGGEPDVAEDAHGMSLNAKDASVNAAINAAMTQLGNDTDESVKRAMAQGDRASPQVQQAQQAQFGIIQGMSLLGGAGLMALGNMVKAGSASISNGVASNKYHRLSGEISTLTGDMDTILNNLDSAGFTSALNGLKDEHKVEFVKEFMSRPENKQQVDNLVQSVGNLSTKAEKALVAGAAAGFSADQLDVEVGRKIKSLNDKHKLILDSLEDHNGKKLSERLDSVLNRIGEMLQQLFRAVTDKLGFNQRPGM